MLYLCITKAYITYTHAAAAAAKSLQSCPTLRNPIDCSPPGSSTHGIFQARTLEWGAISFFRRSSRLGDWIHISCTGGWILHHWATWEAHYFKCSSVYMWRRQWHPNSSTLAWKIPWMEEPGGLQSTGSLRVGHNWATSLSLFTFMHWRRKWQPTPVFLPGESQGRGSLVGCRLWGRTESDTTEAT